MGVEKTYIYEVRDAARIYGPFEVRVSGVDTSEEARKHAREAAEDLKHDPDFYMEEGMEEPYLQEIEVTVTNDGLH